MKLLLAASYIRLLEAELALSNHFDNCKFDNWTLPTLLQTKLREIKPTTLEGYIWCPANSDENERGILTNLAYVVWEYKNVHNIMPNTLMTDITAKLKL